MVRMAHTLLMLTLAGATPVTPPDRVLQAQARRVEMFERVLPSVVCIFDKNLRGGGSGVLIDEDGYGLSNYHVLSGLLSTRSGWGGLGDGILYELEVLGIDVTGDVAMFRLIPPKQPYRFPHAKLGDSDRVRLGDQAIAMGNPFMLSDDYSPSITLGLVTGVHRYQAGKSGNLTYSDCIQTDAPINPGNSGGPLFNAAGEVIGINGRISINRRGRFNVGFGYAITANQIKRFMPSLRAGLLARHGTWQAIVEKRDDGSIVFDTIQSGGPVDRVGVQPGDRIVSIDGVTVTSVNHVVSLMGTYPADWPLSLTTERDGMIRRSVVRLNPIQPKMRKHFEVDQDVNRTQVRRTLAAFQRTVFGDVTSERLTNWNWKVRREYAPGEDGNAKPPESFLLAIGRGAPLSISQFETNGSGRQLFEYDGETAVRFGRNQSDRYELDNEASMILATLYIIFQQLLAPVEDLTLEGVRHAGGDALVGYRFDVDAGATQVAEDGPLKPRLLEVIEWPVTDQARAKFCFDAETSNLVRARVLDTVSGVEAVMDFGDHRDVGGFVWPCSLTVDGAGFHYRDTLSRWEPRR